MSENGDDIVRRIKERIDRIFADKIQKSRKIRTGAERTN